MISTILEQKYRFEMEAEPREWAEGSVVTTAGPSESFLLFFDLDGSLPWPHLNTSIVEAFTPAAFCTGSSGRRLGAGLCFRSWR